MEAKVTFCGGMRFVGQADSGHAVVMDTTVAGGGLDSAVRPSELLLIGLAVCTGMDVISILRKKRQPVSGLEVVVHAVAGVGPPEALRWADGRVPGPRRGCRPGGGARAIELSESTYCSVGLTLHSRCDREHVHDRRGRQDLTRIGTSSPCALRGPVATDLHCARFAPPMETSPPRHPSAVLMPTITC